jgi:flagellin
MTMTVINTNVQSLIAQQSLTVNNRSLSKAMEQLSTGKRINSAADDAAGLAISNKMTAQIRGLNQAVRNANDGISLLQTAEGATQEITNMLQRMRELAVQASNGTYSSADSTSLDEEFQQLSDEITRISTNTQWNGMKLFNADADNYIGDADDEVVFQVGMNGETDDTVSITMQSLDAATLAVDTEDLTSTENARGAISVLDTATATVDTFRSELGAKVNRLNYAADNLTNVSTNTEASRSRIMDTDYAKATTEMTKGQIIQQASTAMLAQANKMPQSVLSLLQ